MEFVAIVTALALIEYIWLGVRVGRARGAYHIEAPATTGHPIFERHFRVHQNTLEQMVVFLPSLWLTGYYVGDAFAALLGLVFVGGRAVYAMRYVADPQKRAPGVLISFGATSVLLIAGLLGAIVALF